MKPHKLQRLDPLFDLLILAGSFVISGSLLYAMIQVQS